MSHPHTSPMPLGSINQNIASTSTPSTLTPAKRLAPIFTRSYSRPNSSPYAPTSTPSITNHNAQTSARQDENDAPISPSSSRKRIRLNPPLEEIDRDEYKSEHEHDRFSGIPDYFVNTQIRGEVFESKDALRKVAEAVAGSSSGGAVWRRKRGRYNGAIRGSSLLSMATARYQPPQQPYLETFVTSLLPSIHTPPSLILLPSIHPWSGRPRDYAPPLVVAFSNSAKRFTANTTEGGCRRLMGVTNEEGGIRIIDVDRGTGIGGMEGGWWWRGHGNAVFDMKWSGDDSKVLTTSGDQSAKIHSLTSPTPTLLATLKGHTSSIKTATFLNPDIPHTIATAGRDGNILIYDMRAPGRLDTAVAGRRRVGRYLDGVEGWAAQSGGDIGSVACIKMAHGDGGRRGSGARTAAKSVTSLVALRAQPGILASGGSYDGIVKLWDLRSLTSSRTSIPSHSLPDPTINPADPSRRPRAIHSITECPTTGDLYTLTGDSKIHVLRPSLSTASSPESIQPKTYTDPTMLTSGFYSRVAISPCGRWLSSGSSRGGLMTWDTRKKGDKAVRLGMGLRGIILPQGKDREVSAVDWGMDIVAGCSDDYATRIWRPDAEAAKWLERDPEKAGVEWAGMIR